MLKPFSPYNVERHRLDDHDELARELGQPTAPIPRASVPVEPTPPVKSVPRRDPRLAVLSLSELELYYLAHWTDEQREWIIQHPAEAMAWYREHGNQLVNQLNA